MSLYCRDTFTIPHPPPVNHDGICELADNNSSSDEDLIVKCKMAKVDIDQQSIASVVSESTALPKCVKLVK